MGKHSADSGADTAQVSPAEVAQRLGDTSGPSTTVFARLPADTTKSSGPGRFHGAGPRLGATEETTVIPVVEGSEQPRTETDTSVSDERDDRDYDRGQDHGQGAEDGGEPVDGRRPRRQTVGRWIAVVVFWLAAMVVGFVAALVCVARYGCSGAKAGFACGHGGVAVGIVLLIVVVLTVGICTVLCFDSEGRARHWLRPLGAGALALVVVLLIARAVLGTV